MREKGRAQGSLCPTNARAETAQQTNLNEPAESTATDGVPLSPSLVSDKWSRVSEEGSPRIQRGTERHRFPSAMTNIPVLSATTNITETRP
eukprot:CAMPEP_0181212210 /NCGR_PEP_ID=MMETSP1096-20121128/24224_1 /TAXON_ID=156174 ORGANISM="Chrysochromulina ericina, Strain CCMP281" /NCGR_SAMPLE_ID=MMETSP1096 /ASSEMBLY_ACC=CAM_ASM_000453 /LENGTH=90 /DNA_ID=CAMNT_0023303715 /DNA_START=43 /DNA_END=315 /DNA_ORIENTATION=-